MNDNITKFIRSNRLHLAVAAAVVGLVACGGDDSEPVAGGPGTPGGPGGGGVPLVPGTGVPVAATTDFQAATEFVASIVNAGGSETAEPLAVGDVTLASSETAEPDPRF
ncbi:MAG: hypothetical protein EOO28_15450 [Comamonadaceae bacterium]|nr:MAG: hypothetical protein EOO28_15450 [Comamonadaceae bacterium]